MKSHTEYITINTKKRKEIINITAQVEKAIENSKIKEGLCLIWTILLIVSPVFKNCPLEISEQNIT